MNGAASGKIFYTLKKDMRERPLGSVLPLDIDKWRCTVSGTVILQTLTSLSKMERKPGRTKGMTLGI